MTEGDTQPWLASRAAWGLTAALALTIVITVSLARSAMAAQLALLAALVWAIAWSQWLWRRGLLPKHSGVALRVGVLIWLVGHVVETYTVYRNPHPAAFGLSDVFALASALVLLAVGVRLWRRSATYIETDMILRGALDALLTVLAVVVLYWHTVIAMVDPRLEDGVGAITATGFTALLATASVILLTRAVNRREAGSWQLFASVTIIALGVVVWANGKIGTDLRVIGTPLQAIGVLMLPVALANPGHGRLVVIGSLARRDRAWAIIILLVAWALVGAVLLGDPVGPDTLVLGVVSVVALYLRVRHLLNAEGRLVRRLETYAFTDPLTGVGNRRSLTARLTGRGSAWLLTIDLDDFKTINDRDGHEAGDEALIDLVARLRQVLPRDSHLARIGGDEFAVVTLGSSAEAEALAIRLVGACHDPLHPALSASVGVAPHLTGADPAATLRDSDIALQEAKRCGKNVHRLLTDDLRSRRLRDLLVAERLRAGLQAVRVHYQPIVTGSDARTVAVEALARWSDPTLGEVEPGEFIPICESNGLIGALGAEVFDRVLDDLRHWRSAGLGVQVSVNVSLLQLCDTRVIDDLVARLQAHPDLAPWLILEVTESVLSSDPRAVDSVTRLRSLGVLIAVDDFGTGASTMTRLLELPVDVLKVDQSLLRNLDREPRVRAVLQTVHSLGRSLGVAVIAEGIEDQVTASIVNELSFELVQGYLFGHPGPPDTLALHRGQVPYLSQRQGSLQHGMSR